ncbi:MAG: hypothetical protein ABSG96_23050 [Terracidiphilus sp.]|jgi:hypothetical protein
MDFDDRLSQLIEGSLRAARRVIEEGGTFEFLAHIAHPGGVQSLTVKGLSSDPSQRAEVNDQINFLMGVLRSSLLITISDARIGEVTSDNCAVSFDSLFSGRRKALVVVVWVCGRKLTSGMQEYMRFADGQVLFGELLWRDPSTSSGF